MIILRWLNSRRSFWRWSLKALLLCLLILLVLYPRIDLLPKTIHRYLDPNSLINPNSAALGPMINEFETERQPDWTKTELMNHIESFVYHKIPYAYDWNLWVNVDYRPTVEETIKKGKEDCDGRAIVAASMLQRYGFDATLVGNFQHIWVKTNIGETMGPEKNTLVQYTAEGGRKFNWSGLRDLPDEFCYDVSVFPLWRELIITLGAWLLLVGRNVRLRQAFVWLALAAVGLLLVREGGNNSDNPDHIKIWGGLLIILLSIVALVVQSHQAARRSTSSN